MFDGGIIFVRSRSPLASNPLFPFFPLSFCPLAKTRKKRRKNPWRRGHDECGNYQENYGLFGSLTFLREVMAFEAVNQNIE